jgi:hypothetical protein
MLYKCLYVCQIAEHDIGNAPEDELALEPLLLWAQATGIGLGLQPHVPTIRTNQQQIENTGKNTQGFHEPGCLLGTFTAVGYVEGDTVWAGRPKVSDRCGMEAYFGIGHHATVHCSAIALAIPSKVLDRSFHLFGPGEA